jgi:hypothetical protein
MSFEIIHFRGADKILEKKSMISDVAMTMEYVYDSLVGSLYRGELLRIALDDMDWREHGTLNILPGRRYMYKGFKRGVAIDGSFSAYEFIIEGLARLQIGFDKGKIEAGILMLTAKRSEKSPYGSTVDMVKSEVELLYPTISLPVSVALFNLGEPDLYLEEENNGVSVQENDNPGVEEAVSG